MTNILASLRPGIYQQWIAAEVGQTIVFRGLSCFAKARVKRRHKPIRLSYTPGGRRLCQSVRA
jgi:hypothetical protein